MNKLDFYYLCSLVQAALPDNYLPEYSYVVINAAVTTACERNIVVDFIFRNVKIEVNTSKDDNDIAIAVSDLEDKVIVMMTFDRACKTTPIVDIVYR